MDKDLLELAELYGLEVTDGPGCIIIDKNGSERPATKLDVGDAFGFLISQPKTEWFISGSNEHKTLFEAVSPWKVNMGKDNNTFIIDEVA